jgi:hypothetical protein
MDYIDRVPELNYMTQIVIMMYENPNKVSAEVHLTDFNVIFNDCALCRMQHQKRDSTLSCTSALELTTQEALKTIRPVVDTALSFLSRFAPQHLSCISFFEYLLVVKGTGTSDANS